MKRLILSIAIIIFASLASAGHMSFSEMVAAAMQGDHRSENNRARDQHRYPAETLGFFGIKGDMTVMEIWPGGGWYTEILAPAMRDHGKLILATWDPEVEGQPSYRYELPKKMAKTFAKYPDVYSKVEMEYFSPPESASLGKADSVDAVVTFRNTHGWVSAGLAQDIFKEFARVLKPGGILGVVQHRAEDGTDPKATSPNGYVSEAAVKKMAAEAGLEFVASSEINANPKDTKDYAQGVWNLPPSLTLGDEDREKYLAIGESDRMTLKFRKP